MSLTLYEALEAATRAMAANLDLPLGYEGSVFTPPVGPHLRASVERDDTRAASCGHCGLTRVDGALAVTVVTTAGSTGEAADIAQAVAATFPRGHSVACTGGEAVFAQPAIGTAQSQGARFRLPIRLPFYALLSGGQ